MDWWISVILLRLEGEESLDFSSKEVIGELWDYVLDEVPYLKELDYEQNYIWVTALQKKWKGSFLIQSAKLESVLRPWLDLVQTVTVLDDVLWAFMDSCEQYTIQRTWRVWHFNVNPNWPGHTWTLSFLMVQAQKQWPKSTNACPPSDERIEE